tara:strand:+ start:281 stop:1648 length:1368 start_codon:yes stop_codon:yes gene_type:complete
MQNREHSFCNEEKNLVLEKRKETQGSCFDFASTNPSLNIDNCDSLCSGTSDGCKVDGKPDRNCNGEAEGEVGGGSAMFKGDTNSNVLTKEECELDLEKRKEELEIPDKLCYWGAMIKLYDGRCENLNKEQISEIFEEKAKYRELENKDWFNLETDNNQCVDIIYDCGGWINKRGGIDPSVKGVTSNDGDKFYINPFLLIDKEFVEVIMLHEGLHTLQETTDREYRQIFGEGIASSPKEFYEKFPDIKLAIDRENILREEIVEVLDNLYAAEIEKEDYWERDREINVGFTTEYIEYVGILFDEGYIGYQDIISEDNYFYTHFLENESLINAEKEYKNYYFGEYQSVKGLYGAYVYVSRLDELDPRLSEVHRWWFDQTGPKNCEVIETSDKAKEVFNKFLSEENIAQEYSLTQKQLRDVIDIAKRMDKESEIYDKLANRLPGLAYDDSSIEDDIGLA